MPFYRAEEPTDIVSNALIYESKISSKGEYVLVNTFEELEGRDAVTALSFISDVLPWQYDLFSFLISYMEGIPPAIFGRRTRDA
jgi:hypothetical protein